MITLIFSCTQTFLKENTKVKRYKYCVTQKWYILYVGSYIFQRSYIVLKYSFKKHNSTEYIFKMLLFANIFLTIMKKSFMIYFYNIHQDYIYFIIVQNHFKNISIFFHDFPKSWKKINKKNKFSRIMFLKIKSFKIWKNFQDDSIVIIFLPNV